MYGNKQFNFLLPNFIEKKISDLQRFKYLLYGPGVFNKKFLKNLEKKYGLDFSHKKVNPIFLIA